MNSTTSKFAGVVLGVAFTPGSNGPPEIPSGGFILAPLRVQRRFVINRRAPSKIKNPPGAAARRVTLPCCSKVGLVSVVMAMAVPMTATVPRRAVVGRCAPNIHRLPAAIVASKHALAIDGGATRTALVRNGAGIPVVMISGLSRGRGENGKAGGEGKELEEGFHGVGLVGGVLWRRWLLPRYVTRSSPAYSCALRIFTGSGIKSALPASQSATLTRPPNQRNLHLS